MALPLDPNLTTLVIRVYYQCYYYVHFLQEKLSSILFQDYGWLFDCEFYYFRQVWFKEDQLQSSLATEYEV